MVESGMIYDGMSTARAIKTARKAAGLSQYELAAKLNYSQATLANWERGAREPPVATFVKILEVCEASTKLRYDRIATDDIQFAELVTMWEELGGEQHAEILAVARKLYSSKRFSNL